MGRKNQENYFFLSLQSVRLMQSFDLMLRTHPGAAESVSKGGRLLLLVRAGSKFKNNVSQRKLHSHHPTMVVCLSESFAFTQHWGDAGHWGGHCASVGIFLNRGCQGRTWHDPLFLPLPICCHFPGKKSYCSHSLKQRYLPESAAWGLNSCYLASLRSDILFWVGSGLQFVECSFCIAYPASAQMIENERGERESTVAYR